MANAAILITNNADSGTLTASSQALTMPVSNLLTPHPSERWRSLTNADYFILDKGSSLSGDTVMVPGLTCGATSTVRLRLSTSDATGAAGDVLDTGAIANGTANFDIKYTSFVWRLANAASWRYTRVDISDPAATYVEAGCIVDGLSESFTYNFGYGGSIQYVDRTRVAPTSSGQTLTWSDNHFRRADLTFQWINETQRYGVVEQLDRDKGRRSNVLLITDTASTNLPRASIFGLVTDITPVTFAILNIFGKQLRIDERV